jgi:hypothetical protein
MKRKTTVAGRRADIFIFCRYTEHTYVLPAYIGTYDIKFVTPCVSIELIRYLSSYVYGWHRGRCYDHNFLRFLTIFGENIFKIITSVPGRYSPRNVHTAIGRAVIAFLKYIFVHTYCAYRYIHSLHVYVYIERIHMYVIGTYVRRSYYFPRRSHH